jgi:hypothetical protein
MNSANNRRTKSHSQEVKARDRRSAQRYQVKWPLRYRVSQALSKGEWKSGHSVDMSSRGILIQTRERIPNGRILEVDMDWPGIYHDKPMVRLFLIGRVTRADGRGTALRILSHDFRDFGDVIGCPERNVAVA